MNTKNAERESLFDTRLKKSEPELHELYRSLYGDTPEYEALLSRMRERYEARSEELKELDIRREADPDWYRSPQMLGMTMYPQLFAGGLKGLIRHLDYLSEQKITYLHLMPLLKMPHPQNDGGYAVEDFKTVDPTIGTNEELEALTKKKSAADNAASLAEGNCRENAKHLRETANKLLSKIKQNGDMALAYYTVITIDKPSMHDVYAIISRAAADMGAALDDATRELERAKSDEARLADIAASVKRAADEEKARRDTLDVIGKSIAGFTARLAETRGKLDGVKGLAFETLKDAKDARVALEREAERIFTAIDAAQAAEVKAKNEETAAVTRRSLADEAQARATEETGKATRALEAALKAAGFTDYDAYRAAVPKAGELDTLEADIKVYDDSVKTSAARLGEAERAAAGKEPQDEAKLKAALAEANEALAKLRKENQDTSTRLKINRDTKRTIEAESAHQKKARDKAGLMDSIYNFVAGSNKDGYGSKLSLEEYVQRSGLRGIIDAANTQFDRMSGGKFEFTEHEMGTGKKNEKNALDLSVVDMMTNKTRDVKTLSGGEKFMAALSLALGMADTISSAAGGITIDTLFIDEGFGSLDGDLLDNTLDMLGALSEDDKLIGVISHREEMKAIGRKIIVTKSAKGSTAKVVVD